MKLTEIYALPLRTIAYPPAFRTITGSVNAAILLRQLLYWTRKERDRSGWIFKRASLCEDDPEGAQGPENQSLEFETGLTDKELFKAREILKRRGFLEDRYERSTHLLYFRLKLEAIRSALVQAFGDDEAAAASPTSGDDPGISLQADGISLQADGISLQADGISLQADGILPKGESLKGTSIDYSKNTSQHAAEAAKGPTPPQLSPEWDLAHGLNPSAQQLERERLRQEATLAFESAVGVNGWPWCSRDVWVKLADVVAEAWRDDHEVFREFAAWMQGEARFTAMNLKQIRMNPQQFLDTGWPMFQASRKPQYEQFEEVETDLERRLREGIGLNGHR